MTPPKAQGNRQSADAPAAPSAVSVCVLAKRAQFLKAAAARRQGTPSFLLQARNRDDGQPTIGLGFTASKKIGNAVLRNRAKRRLREAARAMIPALGQPGWDYVLVARPQATVAHPYVQLLADLDAALRGIHGARA